MTIREKLREIDRKFDERAPHRASKNLRAVITGVVIAIGLMLAGSFLFSGGSPISFHSIRGLYQGQCDPLYGSWSPAVCEEIARVWGYR